MNRRSNVCLCVSLGGGFRRKVSLAMVLCYFSLGTRQLSMKEIFLDVICAVLFEKPLSSVLRTLSVNTIDRANQPCGAS